MVSCTGKPELTPTPSPALSPTETFIEAQTKFEQVVLGQTTKEQVLAIMGAPDDSELINGYEKWWYDHPGGWMILREGIAIKKTFLPQTLGTIINQYGEPESVIQHVLKGRHTASITWLLYRRYNLAVGIADQVESFTPDMRVGGMRTAPGYFDEFMREEGLDGSSTIAEIKTFAWPGFVATPVP
jgi:hypothetical protein